MYSPLVVKYYKYDSERLLKLEKVIVNQSGQCVLLGRGKVNLQCREVGVLRELGKARGGFTCYAGHPAATRRPIATDNWGCGALHGDPPHKAVVQWIVASSEGCAVSYFSFRDPQVGDLQTFATAAIEKLGSVRALFDRVIAPAGCAVDGLYRMILST